MFKLSTKSIFGQNFAFTQLSRDACTECTLAFPRFSQKQNFIPNLHFVDNLNILKGL
jgi:hypothetical protein